MKTCLRPINLSKPGADRVLAIHLYPNTEPGPDGPDSFSLNCHRLATFWLIQFYHPRFDYRLGSWLQKMWDLISVILSFMMIRVMRWLTKLTWEEAVKFVCLFRIYIDESTSTLLQEELFHPHFEVQSKHIYHCWVLHQPAHKYCILERNLTNDVLRIFIKYGQHEETVNRVGYDWYSYDIPLLLTWSGICRMHCTI